MAVAASSSLLVGRLAAGEGVHAVLFYGAPGAGQDRMATQLARAYVCTNPGPEGPCETCQACGAASRGTNADLQVVRPEGAGQMIRQRAILHERNGTDKTDATTVPVRDFVRTGPLLSRNKVCLFFQAHRMNAAAANAFLKTLEEPQAYAKFILVTDAVGRILPTVLSRCLTIPCDLPSLEVRQAAGKAFVVVPQFADRLGEAGFEAFESFVASWSQVSPVAALRLAERLEELAERLDTRDGTDRQSVADALELCATLCARTYPDRPNWTQEIIAAHRRILGNVHAGRVLDALFTKLLA